MEMEKQDNLINEQAEEKKPVTVKRVLWEIAKYTLLTFKWLFIIGLIGGFLGGGAAFGYVSSLVKDDPVRSKETMMAQMQENALTGFVYFGDDTVIGQLRTDEDRRLAELSDIPKIVQDAVLAIEDNNFYQHSGVDIKGTLRAAIQKLLKEDVQTGGSTITQQLARRVFLTLDKADNRKAKEIFLALRMERLMSKDEILLAYLNKIPYGNGSSGYNLYGIKAAAKGIFNIDDLSQINIAQAAYLAGLPQMPSNYSAFNSKGELDGAAFKRAIQRQQLVLKRMVQEGVITEQQQQEALQFDLKASLAEKERKAYSTYPYLMIEVEKEASKALLKTMQPDLDAQKNPEAYSEALKNMTAQLNRGGYHVYTTIDKPIYDGMHAIAEDNANFAKRDPVKGDEQIGAVMIDNKTGAVLGMIEGRDFFSEQLNHATQAFRQPGSTMKPIAAYAPAIEMGKLSPASILDDSPVLLKDNTRAGYHIPENWDNVFHGLMTARRALNQSYNIPAIKLFIDVVGINKAWDYANRLGIHSITKDDYQAQTGVIGGLKYGVSVKELTNAYSALGNKGVFNEAYLIRKITDSTGKTVYEHEAKPDTVFSEQTAYLMTDMMRTVITAGTATDLMSKFNHYGKISIVGKTGSTQDDADAWFMGYTPDVTLGVWAGYELPIHKLTKASGGTNRAKNIWALVLDDAINKRPELFPTTKFTRPEGIVEMTVSSLSGKLPSDATSNAGKLVTDLFNRKYLPTEEDSAYSRVGIISYEGVNYIAKAGTPAEFVQEKTLIKRDKPLGPILKQISSIMSRLPKDRQRPLSFYYPQDYEADAPNEEDPRQDDGNPPAVPSTVVATHSGSASVITFQGSSSSDTVGYRLYRSVNRGNFERVGKVVMAGAETKFTDNAPAGASYGYYVTAVDVAGKESAPSQTAYTDGALDMLLPSSNGGATGTADGGKTNVPGSGQPGTPDAKGDTAGKPNTAGTPATGDERFTSPGGLSARSSGGGVLLKWNAVPDTKNAEGYNIYFSEQEGGPFTKIGLASETTEFKYYAVKYEGYYRVTAVYEDGESKPSAAVRFKK